MEVRVDKFLFAMRLYKTRTIAADACKKGRITMGGTTLKPARTFHVGDVFSVRKGPITYTYRILQLCENRVGAKLVPDYLRDQTAKEQLELLELARLAGQSGRDRGTGRPTKKDRREIETFLSDDYAMAASPVMPDFSFDTDDYDEDLDEWEE